MIQIILNVILIICVAWAIIGTVWSIILLRRMQKTTEKMLREGREDNEQRTQMDR